MKKAICSIFAALVVYAAFSQSGTPGQIVSSFVQVRDVGDNSGPLQRPCMLYLPSGYAASIGGSPALCHLLVYIHGIGDTGPADGSEITELRSMGPIKMLYDNTWNGTGMYTNDCSSTEFIVFAIQTSELYLNHAELEYALHQLYLRYSFGSITFTGASAGGEVTTTYSFDIGRTFRPGLMIPMSVPFTSTSANLSTVAQSGVKMWAFDRDATSTNFYITTSTLVNNFNAAVSGSARFTHVPTTPPGHFGWDLFYNPSYKETIAGQQMSIYDWICYEAKNFPPSPPFGYCPIWLPASKIFAGYITTAQSDKLSSCNTTCTVPVYTDDGTISQGTTLYANPWGDDMGGVGFHCGFSTSKLKNDRPNRYLVVTYYGEVTTYENNCVSPAGYVSTSSQESMDPTCTKPCSTQVYTYTGVVDATTTVYNQNGTAFNGAWAEYGYTTTQYGTAVKKVGISPTGGVFNFQNCSGGGIVNPILPDIAIARPTEKSIRIFPNPASKYIYVQVAGYNEPTTVQLYNMSGVLVYTARITNTSHTIITSNFAKGVYHLKLTNKQGVIDSRKIIVQ